MIPLFIIMGLFTLSVIGLPISLLILDLLDERKYKKEEDMLPPASN